METRQCLKCKSESYDFEVWIDESGFGYSAKLWRCPICGAVQYYEVVEDRYLDVNNDVRFYEY